MEEKEKLNACVIPIVWGVDKKYIFQAFVVMHSILQHSCEQYQFYIITADEILEQVKQYVLLLNSKYNNFEVFVKKVNKYLFRNAKIYNKHLSIAAYFRLLIPNVLVEHDKCIYLDCDIIVNGDLAELYNVSLEDNYLAGVKDCHIIENTPRRYEHEKLLGLPAMDKYVNSGVLVMNLKKMREKNIVVYFIEQMAKENWFEDQDVLNCCCYPHIKTLPLKYNLFHFYYGKSIRLLYHLDYKKEDFNFREPFIVHMGGEWKPWNNEKVKCGDEWWNLAKIFKNTDDYKKYKKNSQQNDSLKMIFDILDNNKEQYIIICGFTKNGKHLCDILMAKGVKKIIAFADNNKNNWGKEYRGIFVKNLKQLASRFNNVFWIISNQVAFNEVQNELFNYGINKQYIIRYINMRNQKMYWLSLNEKYYDLEFEQITEFEFVEKSPQYYDRKEYILQVIENPKKYPEEYNYLNENYYLEYWYNL